MFYDVIMWIQERPETAQHLVFYITCDVIGDINYPVNNSTLILSVDALSNAIEKRMILAHQPSSFRYYESVR